MAREIAEHIVWTTAEDGIPLEGITVRPRRAGEEPLALVWIHGFSGRFSEPHTTRIGRIVASRGFGYVAGNNRGHDIGAMYGQPDGTPKLAGAIWELFDESPLDVGGWLGFAASQGFPRLALAGHSLGALKVAYYQAFRQDPRVAGLIVASPPMNPGRGSYEDPELVALAERMVSEGRGTDLMPRGTSIVGIGTVSAQTFLSRVRSDLDLFGRAKQDPAFGRVRCPVLAFFGTNEAMVGTPEDLEVIKRGARSAPRVDTRVIDGADHVYTGQEDEVGAIVADWLETLP